MLFLGSLRVVILDCRMTCWTIRINWNGVLGRRRGSGCFISESWQDKAKGRPEKCNREVDFHQSSRKIIAF
jgi:hypothetical protein